LEKKKENKGGKWGGEKLNIIDQDEMGGGGGQ